MQHITCFDYDGRCLVGFVTLFVVHFFSLNLLLLTFLLLVFSFSFTNIIWELQVQPDLKQDISSRFTRKVEICCVAVIASKPSLIATPVPYT